ncbi:MAG: choice-of-anchor tandem repeat NxxGxxAF-containing protein [Verrucomicrobiota bacterium]
MKQIATLLFVLYIPACTSAQSTYTIAAIDRPTDAAVPVPTISSTVVDGLSSSGQAIVVGNTDRTFMDATVEGLWVGAPGAMQLLAADDTAAPGTDADTYFAVYDVFSFQQQAANWTIGAGGDAVLMAPLQGPNVGTNKFGVWAGKPGALELIAREGGSAPGTAAGSTFTRISEEVAAGLPGPAVNASGQVAFSASVVAASGQSLGGGIWVGRPGSLQMEAGRAGALINDKGEVAYQGTGGIWTGLPGATKLAVPLREPAPGLPGVTNAVVNGQLAFNNAGHVAFYATLSGAVGLTNNLALWLRRARRRL